MSKGWLFCAACAGAGAWTPSAAAPPGSSAAAPQAAAVAGKPASGSQQSSAITPAAGTPAAGTPAAGTPDESLFEFLGSDDVGDAAWWEFLKKAPQSGSEASARPPQDAKK